MTNFLTIFKIKYYLLIIVFCFCHCLAIVPNAYSITTEEIEQSEEYFQKKAIFVLITTEDKIFHEVSIEGLVISDHKLTTLIGKNKLTIDIEKQQHDQRLLFGGLTGGGLIIGGLLLAVTNAYRQPNSILSNQSQLQTSGLYINGQRFEGNVPLFITGIIGSLLTITGIFSAIQLINEISGINQNNMLDNKVAQQLVEEYNKQLKEEIRKKLEVKHF